MKLTYLSQPMLALNLDYNPSVRDTKEKQIILVIVFLDMLINGVSVFAEREIPHAKETLLQKKIEGTGVLSIDNEDLILQIEYGSIY